MPRVARAVECGHPGRPHQAKGLCSSCYHQTDPIRRAKHNARAAEYQARKYTENPEPQRAKMRRLKALARAARKVQTKP